MMRMGWSIIFINVSKPEYVFWTIVT